MRKRHPRRKRGARPAKRSQGTRGRARPNTPADPAQAEAQPKAGRARPRRTRGPRQKPNPANPTRPTGPKPGNQTHNPADRHPRRARDQRGRLANRTQDHFRIAGLQHRAVLLPSKADEPGTISIVKLGGPRADEGHCLLSRTPPGFEDQRNQLPARGGTSREGL